MYKLDKYIKQTATERETETDVQNLKWIEFEEWVTKQFPESLLRFIPKRKLYEIFKMWLRGQVDKARKQLYNWYWIWVFYMKEAMLE